MPFERPSLKRIYERIAADMDAHIPGARLPLSLLDYLARIYAGAVHGLYGYIDYLARQIFIDSADGASLDRHAGVWGLVRRPAQAARGQVRMTGATGATIPAGTLLQAGGLEYETVAAAVLADGVGLVAVRAREAGPAHNLPQGAGLRLIAPLDGANIQAQAQTPIEGGLDIEADDSLRARLLFLIRNKPHGGARHDYVFWSLDQSAHGVPVTRAWVFPNAMGLGTVTIRAVCDGRADIALTEAERGALVNYIETVRPVTVKEFYVLSPTLVPLNLTIRLNPSDTATWGAVEAELRDLLAREAAPGKTILISKIREAVSIAAGEHDNEVLAPSANIPHAANAMAVLGNITREALS